MKLKKLLKRLSEYEYLALHFLDDHMCGQDELVKVEDAKKWKNRSVEFIQLEVAFLDHGQKKITCLAVTLG